MRVAGLGREAQPGVGFGASSGGGEQGFAQGAAGEGGVVFGQGPQPVQRGRLPAGASEHLQLPRVVGQVAALRRGVPGQGGRQGEPGGEAAADPAALTSKIDRIERRDSCRCRRRPGRG